MIRKDKITIVSGEPRSGTSLMMQTLKELGAPIVGKAKAQEDRLKAFKDDNGEWLPEHLDKKEDIERRVKHSDMMNPIGFYETEFVSSGVRGIEAVPYKGTVMKIITSGIPENIGPHGIHGTSKELINKVILCLRNPKNIAVSQKNLIDDSVLVAGENEDEGWVYHNDAPPSPLAYLNRTGSFIIWLEDNMDIIDDILVVEFEEMQMGAPEQIQRVIDFLGIDVSEDQFNKAVSNVKPSLARSEAFDKWPDNFKEEGELAMEIYDSLLSMSKEKITLISSKLKSKSLENRLERVKWIDCDQGEGTWALIDPQMFRDIKDNKNNLKTNLLKHVNVNSTKCKYHVLSDESYTIQRPEDLGDLTRNMIFCERDEDLRTIEQCLQCWSWGWRRGGVNHAPASQNN